MKRHRMKIETSLRVLRYSSLLVTLASIFALRLDSFAARHPENDGWQSLTSQEADRLLNRWKREATNQKPKPIKKNEDGSVSFSDGARAYPGGVVKHTSGDIEFMVTAEGLVFWRNARSDPEAKSSLQPPNEDRPNASGTGFLISRDGYLLTNFHVVDGAKKIIVRVGDITKRGTLVRSDSTNDVALVKIEGTFAAVPLGNPRKISTGDAVFTVGFPNIQVQGALPKFTSGEISAVSGVQDDPRVFQISVPLQPGNSGGPLVDERGSVIGITASQLSAEAMLKSGGSIPQNVNYALKISYAEMLIDAVPTLAGKLVAPNEQAQQRSALINSTEKAVALLLVWK